MRYLLDTRVWLWLATEPERLSPASRAAAADHANELLLSAASSWEIAIKYSAGKLHLPEEPATWVPTSMARSGVRGLHIAHAHALEVATLPRHHADPFDRLLIAQARLESLVILTVDPVFSRYDVEVMPVV